MSEFLFSVTVILDVKNSRSFPPPPNLLVTGAPSQYESVGKLEMRLQHLRMGVIILMDALVRSSLNRVTMRVPSPPPPPPPPLPPS